MRLPLQPDTGQLRRVLSASLRGEFAVQDEPPAELKHQSSFLTASEVLRSSPAEPRTIRSCFRTLNWNATFKRIACIAADLNATGVRGTFQQHIKKTLASSKRLHLLHALLAEGLKPFVEGQRVIFHEQVLYSLLQMAAEECDPVHGRDPSAVELAFLALLANDHLDRGYADLVAQFNEFVSSLSLALRFNQERDHLRTIARTVSILTDPLPTSAELAREPNVWSAIQEQAFGPLRLDGFLRLFVQPLTMFADTLWGATSLPSLSVPEWYKNAPELIDAVRSWISPMTTTREEIRNHSTNEPVPTVSPLLLRKPFVEIEGVHWAATPWAVMRQLHTGVRARLLRAAGELGKRHKHLWEYAHGYAVEAWCQQISRWAEASTSFVGELHVPAVPGTEEIEDVVVTLDRTAVLFSVKSTLMREQQAFNVSSKAGIVSWYEQFLFAPKQGDKREGAARQLDKKVRAVQRGETSLDKTLRLAPVIVMYDDPLEHVGLIDWYTRRCTEEGLFEGCMPLAIISLDLFEALMALAAEGQDLGELLARRLSDKWRRQRFEVFLHETIPDWRKQRLPALEQRFDSIAAAGLKSLKDIAKIG